MSQGFTTLEVETGKRIDFWREMIRRHFIPLRIDPLGNRAFVGTVQLKSIGELDAVRVRAHPMQATRTRKHIDNSSGDEYFIAVHLHGLAQVEQDGRLATLRPGDFALLDSARPTGSPSVPPAPSTISSSVSRVSNSTLARPIFTGPPRSA